MPSLHIIDLRIAKAQHESTSAVDAYTCTGQSLPSALSSSYAKRNLSRSTNIVGRATLSPLRRVACAVTVMQHERGADASEKNLKFARGAARSVRIHDFWWQL